jgi:hypothetical protein
MSWGSDTWGWYVANSDKANPIVGFVGGAASVWGLSKQARAATNRHYEQTRADQQRRLIESFSRAVEQLGGDKFEARLGGVYTRTITGMVEASPREPFIPSRPSI